MWPCSLRGAPRPHRPHQPGAYDPPPPQPHPRRPVCYRLGGTSRHARWAHQAFHGGTCWGCSGSLPPVTILRGGRTSLQLAEEGTDPGQIKEQMWERALRSPKLTSMTGSPFVQKGVHPGLTFKGPNLEEA